MKHAIGIDLGGTNIKAALVERSSGHVVESRARPTCDGDWSGEVPRFAEAVREAVEDLESSAGESNLEVGLSAPGLADVKGRWIDWMPGRMHGLEKFDWATFLKRRAVVLNDAHAALLGEVWVGAAKDVRHTFMLTLGTGVGGAVFADGKLLRGALGRAGHLGHVTVDSTAEKDVFNTPGSLEMAIGNQTIERRGAGRFENTHAVVKAAKEGDVFAREVWNRSLTDLAAAIASLINVLDPELVIVGGGIAVGAGDFLMEPLRRQVGEFEWQPGGRACPLVSASAGEWAGALGSVYALIHPEI
jgi:glucokinase